jgi:restriction system protein
MGAIWFDQGQLANNLHEILGYKAGIAVSITELCDLLSGSQFSDTIQQSEEGVVRLRSEDYEELYFSVLHKVGHTQVKHNGIVDLFTVSREIRKVHGEKFAEELFEIYFTGFERLLQETYKSGVKTLDPTNIILEAYKKLGKKGADTILHLIETQEKIRQFSPHQNGRWVEWKNIIPLSGIYSRSSNDKSHGEFIDQRLIDFLSNNLNELQKMHWRKFEELTAEHFHRKGYKVELGPGQNDDGVDLRLWLPNENEDSRKQLHIVQCKRTKEKVDKIVVKGLYADVQHEGAEIGVLVTTSELTPGAKQTIATRGYPIEEVNGIKVVEWLAKLRTPGTGIVR